MEDRCGTTKKNKGPGRWGTPVVLCGGGPPTNNGLLEAGWLIFNQTLFANLQFKSCLCSQNTSRMCLHTHRVVYVFLNKLLLFCWKFRNGSEWTGSVCYRTETACICYRNDS